LHRYQVPGTWYQYHPVDLRVPGTLPTSYLVDLLVPGTRYQVPGTNGNGNGAQIYLPVRMYIHNTYRYLILTILICILYHIGMYNSSSLAEIPVTSTK